MHEVVFVVKSSKFCNLRCSYCYEHRELHIRDAMHLETLERLFADIDLLGDHFRSFGVSPRFSFVWHGGEPLLLPPDYYAAIVALQERHIRTYSYRNSVQSNLFGSVRETLAFVADAHWELGVSVDFAEGIRINAGGRDSNASVIASAEALRGSGVRFGVISVLGTHNRNALPQAYDWVSEFGDGWRILPVFDGGPAENIGTLRLPDDEIVETLLEVFQKRSTARRHIPVEPIDGYLRYAARKIAGVRASEDIERDILDNVFLLNVNGDVYTRPFAYDAAFCLGNINDTSMKAMIAGDAYAGCRRVLRRRKDANCRMCDYAGFCDLAPMHENGCLTAVDQAERCVFPRRTTQGIEGALLAAGVDRSTIAGWVRESPARPGAISD